MLQGAFSYKFNLTYVAIHYSNQTTPYPVQNFGFQERLHQSKENFENRWTVETVDAFDAHREAVLLEGTIVHQRISALVSK